jgi:hypothetical protein
MGGCLGWLARHRMKASYGVSILAVLYWGQPREKFEKSPMFAASGFFRI